jgi:hypothetical protein
MQTNNRKVKMQTKEHIDLANSMTKITRTGHLYGQLFAIKDMQIHLLKEEKKIKDEIERCESLEKLKERKNK